MSAPLPVPLTPPDCDLRGFPYMPLDVIRLVDSDLFALSTGDEFKIAVALWCKSWSQVPAGSLPDDDRILAHLSAAGMGWSAVREMALRGWVKCRDGRLYHPVVAEKALIAWKQRQMQREKGKKRWGNKPGSTVPPGGTQATAEISGATAVAAAKPSPAPAYVNGAAARITGATAIATAQPRNREGREKEVEEEKQESAATAFSVTPRESGGPPDDADPEPVVPRDIRLMPKRSDPEERWRCLGAGHEDDTEPHTLKFTKITIRSDCQLRVVAELVCQAAMIHDEHWQGDWWTLAAWLDDKISVHEIILPVIRRMASRPGFTGVGRLAYFDGRIRETWQNSNVVRFG